MTDRTGAQTYFLSDGLGSTANLTNGADTTTASYSYDAFGGMRLETGTGAGGKRIPLHRASSATDGYARALLQLGDRVFLSRIVPQWPLSTI